MLYLETSALLKKYWREPGSDKVLARLDSQDQLGSNILTLVEIEAVLGRLLRQRFLPERELLRQRRNLLSDWTNIEVVELGENVIAEVRRLVLTLPLTAGDAIHLASALLLAARIEGLIFCSADASLLRSAATEGLRTWSPLT